MYSSQGSQSKYQELTLVKLSKNSIDFPYIPDKYLHFILTITNESNFHIAYKFKSTQPQKYLVKTDQNIIEPHKEARINFTMHPDLIKDKLHTFKDNFQLVVAKLQSNESLENIFKRNKGVIESQVAKLQVRIIGNPNGEVLNNQNKLTASSNNFQSPNKNGAFDSASSSSSNLRQNLIPVDLKGQQDPNLKYQNINNSTAFLSQKLQEKEDQLHNIQRETERINQNIQSMTGNNTRTAPTGGQGKGGKSITMKAIAVGILLGVGFTIIQNLFSSNIEAINPLNL